MAEQIFEKQISKLKTQFFIPNQGQLNTDACFYTRFKGHQFYFHKYGITAVLYSEINNDHSNNSVFGSVLVLGFPQANSTVTLRGMDETGTKVHYIYGEPDSWHTNLPMYKKLQYTNLWEGVDLLLTDDGNGLKFLWSLDEAGRIGAICMQYEGAEELTLDDAGNLIIRHAIGEFRDPKPVAWQEAGGEKVYVACSYVIENGKITFAISGNYNASAPLVIDPVLSYVSYLGGSNADQGKAITADAQGCAYVTGLTSSVNFPTTPGAFQTVLTGNSNVFVSKFASDGASLIYSTYLGGSGNDESHGIAVDSTGSAYVTGFSNSTDFPVTPGAFQTAPAGGGTYNNAFLTKLSEDGANLIYSTYLGGNSDSESHGISLDAQFCAYVTGFTLAADFPTTPGAFQTAYHGNVDAFVTKFSTNASSLLYSTYLGGSNIDSATAIAVDLSGCAYVTGFTYSADFPVTSGAFQETLGAGGQDAFVTKLNAAGSSLYYSSFLGGNGFNGGNAIAVDSIGQACVAGSCNSTNFPVTPNAFQSTYGGGNTDMFITKFTQDGSRLAGSTYLGGSELDGAYGVALDAQSRPHITGYTNSANFPITPDVILSSYSGNYDSVVSILSADLSSLLVSYYLGGAGIDIGYGIAVGSSGGVYTTGTTTSADFPVTPGAFQTVYGGTEDAYVSKDFFALPEKASIVILKISS